jgi:L-aminopeptidase/D-esterase-like protein
LSNGLIVGAIAAVNAAGDIVDPKTGAVIAGVRNPDGNPRGRAQAASFRRAARTAEAGQNTTIAVVATNATLTKAQANRLALMADDGLARANRAVAHQTATATQCSALATGRWTGAADISIIAASRRK